jgi:GT2 family glycosyltransferase/glycosyltransferase involved in cell wall biosynthesis
VSIPLHTSPEPRVSVLILTQKDAGLLRGCLTSLARHLPPAVPTEVLVLCNGARPEVVAFAQRELTGARVFVSPVNLGFGGGNNRLAREARGELLLLLNDDAEVEPGWLEPLVETLDEHPDAAAVGSRILFPDGRVQEAGSVLFDDGSTAPVGRGLPPGSGAYAYRRQVDYTSANSLLLRKTAFEQVGGFDEGFHPAYYEDVDLALSLRTAGWQWLYDGRSRIRHQESASTTTHYKHWLFARNIERIRSKWSSVLAGQLERPPGGGPDGPEPATIRAHVERARGNPPKVLVVDDMLPVRGLGAGAVLMHELALQAGLSRYSLSISVTKHPGADPLSVAGLGLEVVEGDLADHLAQTSYDAVVVCRPSNYDPVAPLLARHQPQAAVVYVAEALFSSRLEREAALLPAEDERRARVLAEAAETQALEERIVRSVDRVAAVSVVEAAVLRAVPGAAPVDAVPPLQPDLKLTPAALDARANLAFVASWTARGHTPNSDAFWWLVEKVLPHVLPPVPWTRLRVTGANPPDDITAVAGPHVELTGFLPELEPLYRSIRVIVAADRFGAGLKNKTLEALQYGVPVVATTIGAEGIEVPPGLQPMIVTDDPEEFGAAVVRLLTDNDEWRARRADVEALHASWQDRPGPTWPDVVDAALTRKAGR